MARRDRRHIRDDSNVIPYMGMVTKNVPTEEELSAFRHVLFEHYVRGRDGADIKKDPEIGGRDSTFVFDLISGRRWTDTRANIIRQMRNEGLVFSVDKRPKPIGRMNIDGNKFSPPSPEQLAEMKHALKRYYVDMACIKDICDEPNMSRWHPSRLSRFLRGTIRLDVYTALIDQLRKEGHIVNVNRPVGDSTVTPDEVLEWVRESGRSGFSRSELRRRFSRIKSTMAADELLNRMVLGGSVRELPSKRSDMRVFEVL
jgi:hypothetical protein